MKSHWPSLISPDLHWHWFGSPWYFLLFYFFFKSLGVQEQECLRHVCVLFSTSTFATCPSLFLPFLPSHKCNPISSSFWSWSSEPNIEMGSQQSLPWSWLAWHKCSLHLSSRSVAAKFSQAVEPWTTMALKVWEGTACIRTSLQCWLPLFFPVALLSILSPIEVPLWMLPP